MKRRIFFGILIGSLFGCREKLTEAPKSISTQQNSDQKPFAPTVEKVANEPKVKPSVWLPPLEKYEKPEKKEKWFRPEIVSTGGVAVTCSTCRGNGQLPCPKCGGTGRDGIPLESSTLRDMTLGRRSSNPCIQCDGSGRQKCNTCGGAGYLKERG